MNTQPNPEIIISDIRERRLLFASLYFTYGLWSESFTVSDEGQITPNSKWWRQRNILQKSRISTVLHFCAGWIAARKAEEIESEVLSWADCRPKADGQSNFTGTIPQAETASEQSEDTGFPAIVKAMSPASISLLRELEALKIESLSDKDKLALSLLRGVPPATHQK